MGDQIGEGLTGDLFYIDAKEMEKLVRWDFNDEDKKIGLLSDVFRFNCLYMIARAGSGHIGSSFSSMELFTYLKLKSHQKEKVKDSSSDII